jgi:hypothetical protein
LGFALATALVGLIVSFAMMYRGGSMANHLPDEPFHIGAFIGAGAAGWLCMGAFGRIGPAGAFCSVGGGIGATLLGAAFGTWVCLPIVLFVEWFSSSLRSGSWVGDIDVALLDLLEITVMSPVLGLTAIIDAATSPAALLVWCLGMASLHVYARALRVRGPIPRISLRRNA